MQPDVTPFFTIATTSSGSPSIAIKFWKEHCASGYEPSFGRFARNWGYRSSRAFCPKSMSTCSSRYHRISRSATSFAVSKGAHRIAFRWSSQNFANVTGVAISGRGATSAPPAATSQTRRYFSISSIMNLPASAGSYSVRKQAQVRKPRIGKPFPDLSQALCDHRKPYPRTKELRGLSSGGEIAKAVTAIPDLDQTKHRKLLDHVRRQFAQSGELVRAIGLGLFLRRDFADPFKEPAFADNRDTIGFRLGQALRRPSVFLERPTELANDHDACILGDPHA